MRLSDVGCSSDLEARGKGLDAGTTVPTEGLLYTHLRFLHPAVSSHIGLCEVQL